MKIVLKTNLLFILAIAFSASLQAQKFGHVNSGNLLAEMPGTGSADTLLMAYQDSLVAIGEERAKALEAEFAVFYESYQGGEVTPAVAQKKQQEFQRRDQELMAFEEEVANMVGMKRKELIEPFLIKLQAAINEVAEEGGYTMIFDTSIFNAIVFAGDSDDIGELVLAKLNAK